MLLEKLLSHHRALILDVLPVLCIAAKEAPWQLVGCLQLSSICTPFLKAEVELFVITSPASLLSDRVYFLVLLPGDAGTAKGGASAKSGLFSDLLAADVGALSDLSSLQSPHPRSALPQPVILDVTWQATRPNTSVQKNEHSPCHLAEFPSVQSSELCQPGKKAHHWEDMS